MYPQLVTAESRRSLADVENTAVRVAEVLRTRGVGGGTRVLLMAGNSGDYLAVLFALMHLDASIVLLDHRQTEAERARVVREAGVHHVIRDRVAVDPQSATACALGMGTLLFEARSLSTVAQPLEFAAWYRRRDALICWSSGTTGEPKGVVRSGASVRDNIERTMIRMAYRPDDVLLPLLPFSHQYGLSLVLSWWLTGCSLVVANYTRLDHAIGLGGTAGATVVDATPSTYYSLLNLVAQRAELALAVRTVDKWCVGGAPLSPALADRFRRERGQLLLDGYGSTEAGNIALSTPENPIGCGRPLDGVDVRIQAEDGTPLAPGVVGEICVRTPTIMQGYLGPDGTVLDRDEEVLHTNDIGYQDESGNIFPIGRKSAVHRLGHTLYTEELARKAEECGREVCVVPVEDERRGSQLVFVVADPDGGEPRYWRRRISGHLAGYESPDHVLVVPEFPLNSNGKPDLLQLEQLVMESLPRVGGSATALPQPRSEDHSAVGFPERVEAIRAVAAWARANPQPLLEILTEVSNHATAAAEVTSFVETLEGAVQEVSTYRPGPVGRAAVFMPSNILLYSYALYLLVPALYTGEIRFRPSSQVAAQTRHIHELLAPLHGLPLTLSGASQREFLAGPVAEADMVVFTGTYKNAENVRAGLRDDQLFVFFGQGVNPFVVAPGADLPRAVRDAVRIRMVNSGQDCFGPDVYFVHDDEVDEFVDLLATQLSGLIFGRCADAEADYGPLHYDSALEFAADYLRRNAQHIVHGGQVDFRLRLVEPTVLYRPFGDKAPVAEMFAPLFNVVAYTDPGQLRQRLSSSFFNERAMGAMVYGDDPETVRLLRRKHQTCVNETLLDVENGNQPFGGHGMIANYLSYRGKRHAEPLLLSKAVAEHFPRVVASRSVSA